MHVKTYLDLNSIPSKSLVKINPNGWEGIFIKVLSHIVSRRGRSTSVLVGPVTTRPHRFPFAENCERHSNFLGPFSQLITDVVPWCISIKSLRKMLLTWQMRMLEVFFLWFVKVHDDFVFGKRANLAVVYYDFNRNKIYRDNK